MRTRIIEFNGQTAEIDIDAITHGHIEIKSKQTGAHQVALFSDKEIKASFVVYSMGEGLKFLDSILSSMREENARYFPKVQK